ncbi:MAG: putative LPS assembly protein LptD [Bacteroidetes bacterium]|nr:putative LPS assembly protein LptD [Bacteroidota bacterium]
MSKLCKFNVKTLLAIVVAGYLLILTIHSSAAKAPFRLVFSIENQRIDTVPTKQATKYTVDKETGDTTFQDSIPHIDTLHISKDSIDAPIKYSGDDSGVLIIPTRQFYLYGKARMDYKDMKLDAATIKYDQQSQEIKAFGGIDTANNPLNKPHFDQGETKTISDTIAFNTKSGKAYIQNTFLQEGEIYVNAEKLKKISADEAFARRARFTTCNLDTPHFAFRTAKMKIINNKIGVSGPAFPEFEGVPMPVGIPFGIYPLSRGRHSGILPPSFITSEDFGVGLENFGYYKVINDNLDFTTRANLYSYGGWLVNLNSKYIRRYRYTGNLNVTFQNSKILNKSSYSLDEFNVSKSYMINWSHSSDQRARPGTSFGASVNFGSTKFNKTLLNNPYQNYNNQLSSSINYSKDWRGKYNLSLNANHNQNSNSGLVNMNLPTANFSVITFYPFQKKESIGSPKWYEKLGLGYTGNLQNQFSFYDSTFNFKRMIDTMQWGAQHNIPITLSLPSLGPVTVSPSISYEERWYGQRNFKSWNDAKQKVDTTIQKGFYTARQMSFGIGMNTRIFGTYKFKKSNSIKAIRHEIRPSLSVNYKPDMAGRYYYSTQVDTAKNRVRFSQFDGGILGSFSEGKFGGMGFGVDNLLEMKVRDKSDSTGVATKKVKLIDGFGFSSNYNFMADSFALGNFSLYARSTLFEKVNITASASLDPYKVDNKGYRQNELLFDPAHFKFGRITSANLAISTSFKSKTKDEKAGKEKKELPIDPFMTPDEQQRQLQFAKSNPAEFTDFNVPWSLSFSYSLNYTRTLKADYSAWESLIYSSMNFNGDFTLTPKWKMGGTGYFDFNVGKLQQLSMFITREMHCWQLAINLTPIGLYRSFNITVNPKSGILRDLKINRSRTFSNY